MPTVRPYRPDDRAALGDICVRTAHEGGDSRHIHPDLDLLPDHRRRGHGRALMNAFLDALHRKGVAAAHPGRVTADTAARAFYDRLGFHEIPVAGPGPLTYLGRRTAPM
ncbi:GNAT family N-acetyltransferase [Streptosporangium sandarakinum]|uniref:GNAT family N-acetyltransferase n=1 Tax=Streptosporangium sandarakinum TaxID=1260955 RepID=UPI0037206159